jgi:hypothetical protein
MKRLFFAALTGTAIPAFWLSRRYRHDMNAARARLAAVERHDISCQIEAKAYPATHAQQRLAYAAGPRRRSQLPKIRHPSRAFPH